MKSLFFVQRVLAAVIDLIIVYIPVSVIVKIVFTGYFSSEILAAILFVVYNVVAIHSFNGQTIGKYFAKLQVSDTGASIMDDSVRESVKILYFLPILGLIIGLLSVCLYFVTGRFFHDIIGKSEVVNFD